jgi:putative ABC transport system substrate-binding protein
MGKKLFSLALSAMLYALSIPAQAQQPTKIPRVGYLATNSHSVISARVEAFRQGLRELGYVEGKNIVIEYRYAEGGENGKMGMEKWGKNGVRSHLILGN